MNRALSLIKALSRVGFKVSFERSLVGREEHWHIEVRDKAGNTSNYNGPTIEQAIESARRAEGVP